VQTFRISDLLVAVMEESGYLQEMQADDTSDGRSRVENLQELVGVRASSKQSGDELDARGFLANIALVSDLDVLDPMHRTSR